MAVDKPSVNLTLAALMAETKKPEPFVFALSGSKRITFPDIFDVPAEESLEFFRDMQASGQNDFDLLRKWLSKADFEAYQAAKLPLRVHANLVSQVMDYYRSTMGDLGEDSASKG